MTRKLSATVAATVVPALVLLASPATAGDDDVERAKNCGAFRIELKVGPEDGGWEVESDIDDAAPRSRWRVVIRQDGERVLNQVRRADGQGNVEVDIRRPDTSGRDRFRFIATRVGSPGTRCSIAITRS